MAVTCQSLLLLRIADQDMCLAKQWVSGCVILTLLLAESVLVQMHKLALQKNREAEDERKWRQWRIQHQFKVRQSKEEVD